MPTVPREELEREIASLRERLGLTVEVVRTAKSLLDAYAPLERRKELPYRISYALIESVAKLDGFALPLIVERARRAGLREASEVALKVAANWNEEGAAAARSVAEVLEGMSG